MTVAAIDPGHDTGWAVRTEDGSVTFGTWRLGTTREKAGRRINWLRDRLSELHSLFLPTSYIYEKPFINTFVATSCRPLVHYEGTILAHADRLSLPVRGFDSRAAKKAFGKPGLSKDQMIVIARRLGHDVQTSHEADAVALLYASVRKDQQMSLQVQKRGKKAVP